MDETLVNINHIETIVPEGSFEQKASVELQKRLIADEKVNRYIDAIYEDSGIERRHSVVVDDQDGLTSKFYLCNGVLRKPSTKERNDLFAESCSPLVIKVAEKAIRNSGFLAKDFTHVITVSCTGFYNPGPDLAIIENLRLPSFVQRYHLGFMGCYASVPALRMAYQFCKSDPKSVILIVCVELCSLHFQPKKDLDTIIANSLFADGAAAVIVSTRNSGPAKARFALCSFHSEIIEKGANEMAWKIGDTGFDIVLSKYVPKIIGSNIAELIAGILDRERLSFEDIGVWAVHPGGKSILDQVQRNLGLSETQLLASREILRRFGNMSSVTLLFVLKEILEQYKSNQDALVYALAFGPGLVAESALLNLRMS